MRRRIQSSPFPRRQRRLRPTHLLHFILIIETGDRSLTRPINEGSRIISQRQSDRIYETRCDFDFGDDLPCSRRAVKIKGREGKGKVGRSSCWGRVDGIEEITTCFLRLGWT